MDKLALQPGRPVTLDLDDYLVTAQREYRDGGLTWTEWLLEDAGRGAQVWLVRHEEALALGGDLPPPCGDDLSAAPGTMDLAGKALRLVASGRAHLAEQTEEKTRFDRVDYALYAGADGGLVSVVKDQGGLHCRGGAALDRARIETYST